jgi:hypothetical protein
MKNPETNDSGLVVAGEKGFEPSTHGFGDRCSTIEPLPFDNNIGSIVKEEVYVKARCC